MIARLSPIALRSPSRAFRACFLPNCSLTRFSASASIFRSDGIDRHAPNTLPMRSCSASESSPWQVGDVAPGLVAGEEVRR
jgi:hypothetical protein